MNKRVAQVLLPLCIFWLLPLTASYEAPVILYPRTFIPHDKSIKSFYEEVGIFLHTMILGERHSAVFVGSTEQLHVLSIYDVSKKISTEYIKSNYNDRTSCVSANYPAVSCLNHIRILHLMKDGRIFACTSGSGFSKCGVVTYESGEFTLGIFHEKNGTAPNDQYQTFASLMVENNQFAASHDGFLRAAMPTFARMVNGKSKVTSIHNDSWFKDPSFVSISLIPESRFSLNKEPDKVFLFFTETQIDCDCRKKETVSRVARVCANDLGGNATMANKWTTFLKAKIDCPLLKSREPLLLRDTFLWCGAHIPWSMCTIYAIFTSHSKTSDLSGVCIYRVRDMNTIFSGGTFRKQYNSVWLEYTPPSSESRPGQCENITSQGAGRTRSQTLSKEMLEFASQPPYMEAVIEPFGKKPLFALRGALFTQVVVTEVQAADGKLYQIMFFSTDKGTVVKAVHSLNEVFVIEEIQVSPHPIKELKYSSITKQLYVLTAYGVHQLSSSYCDHYETCVDCVLARDPYCGWDPKLRKCIRFKQQSLIQSVNSGDASKCTDKSPADRQKVKIIETTYLKLSCQPSSIFAKVIWERNNSRVKPSVIFKIEGNSLVIPRIRYSDRGIYSCVLEEASEQGSYTSTLIEYEVEIERVKYCSSTVTNCNLLLEEQLAQWRLYFLLFYAGIAIFGFILCVFLIHSIHRCFRAQRLSQMESGTPTESLDSENPSIELSQSTMLEAEPESALKLDASSLALTPTRIAK